MSDYSKIIGVQFSLLSPEEILRGSVTEITSKDTYNNNKPVLGGLFDPRMGVIDHDMLCPTDGHNHMKTPGYFGHIVLARPVFYMHFMKDILKILKCVCFKCSKLLISKESHKHVSSLPSDARWAYISKLAGGITRCGELTEDGCGCLQPTSIVKEGLATINAEWKSKIETDDPVMPTKQVTNSLVLTAEIVLKIFKRISDDDVDFMGFNSIWSRPEWMICQVMIVPPPCVRPSVKQNDQQRSEDDLSHILVDIIKANKMLQEKIQTNASSHSIDDWTTLLQYYVASQVDNNIKGFSPMAQRSGRSLKSIKDRLIGKPGRMRGNLMAKRVDFSARSVITADPNISIRELGVPLSVAMNLTKPAVVNERTKSYLLGLVRNGPDVYPGAKSIVTKMGEISLRVIDRNSIVLNDGDIVHRHIINGDMEIFNRQPTLHRMSIMGHVARVMMKGETFRLNVADTKPYNADFDGDEMNMHMPQNGEAEMELRQLAAIPYQIISPGNNSSIIGIFQDSMLGCYKFTQSGLSFDARTAMNLLMSIPDVNENKVFETIRTTGSLTNFELLSHILPPMTTKRKTSKFDFEKDDYATSNKVLEIKNGEYIRGQLDKGSLGGRTKGILQRICNDFGNMAASNFIDNIQNIVTDYLKTASFSVGVGDLLITEKTSNKIIDVINTKNAEVAELIDKVHLGIFKNTTGLSNQTAVETGIKNILDKSRSESGRVGLNGLADGNRFYEMERAGSKGSTLNITFMVACLGQQDIEGKRIPYGFDSRTLPHYTKYEDTGVARGFVENSYLNGLSPQELYFHAMGGRTGLIDTAVKTAVTGYIQRRFIKAMEDLVVGYDMTVRTNTGNVIQYICGNDCFDTTKMESQQIPLVNMSIEEIYAHYALPKTSGGRTKTLTHILTPEAITRTKSQTKKLTTVTKTYIDFMIEKKGELIKHVFRYTNNSEVHCPVAFSYIIDNICGQCGIDKNSTRSDVTVMEVFTMMEHYNNLLDSMHYGKPNMLFKTLYYFYLSPKVLVLDRRMTKTALTLLFETVVLMYKRALIAPGEAVGIIAGQSIGEVSTQMTLNTFHFAGVASKSNVTRGVPRLEEITKLTSAIKNPSMTVYMKKSEETDKDKALATMHMLEHTPLNLIVESVSIVFDPRDTNTRIEEDNDMIEKFKRFEALMEECASTNTDTDTDEGVSDTNNTDNTKSKWVIRIVMNAKEMLNKNITMDDVQFTLKTIYDDKFDYIYSDFNSDELVFRLRLSNILENPKSDSTSNAAPLDQADQIYLLKNIQETLLQNVVLRGVPKIKSARVRTVKNTMVEENGGFEKHDIWVLDTVGSNLLGVLALDFIDQERTTSNDIMEIYNVLGIEAARNAIITELIEVIEFDNTYVNYHHFNLLADRMTYRSKMMAISRNGLNNDDIGPIVKASFEETPEMFMRAGKFGELDTLNGVSANVMCGQEGMFGTNAFQVVLDLEHMETLNAQNEYTPPKKYDEEVNEAFMMDDVDGSSNVSTSVINADKCSVNKITIRNNIANIIDKTLESDDEEYDPGF